MLRLSAIVFVCAVVLGQPASVHAADSTVQTDLTMRKILTLIKADKYGEALPYFSELERSGVDLPESFYFYQITALSKTNDADQTIVKAEAYFAKYGKAGKNYDKVLDMASAASVIIDKDIFVRCSWPDGTKYRNGHGERPETREVTFKLGKKAYYEWNSVASRWFPDECSASTWPDVEKFSATCTRDAKSFKAESYYEHPGQYPYKAKRSVMFDRISGQVVWSTQVINGSEDVDPSPIRKGVETCRGVEDPSSGTLKF